jgi:hypothetical protein
MLMVWPKKFIRKLSITYDTTDSAIYQLTDMTGDTGGSIDSTLVKGDTGVSPG